MSPQPLCCKKYKALVKIDGEENSLRALEIKHSLSAKAFSPVQSNWPREQQSVIEETSAAAKDQIKTMAFHGPAMLVWCRDLEGRNLCGICGSTDCSIHRG